MAAKKPVSAGVKNLASSLRKKRHNKNLGNGNTGNWRENGGTSDGNTQAKNEMIKNLVDQANRR